MGHSLFNAAGPFIAASLLLSAPLLHAGGRNLILVRQGGSFSFSVFLSKLRDGAAVDKALEDTYAGLWKKLSEVEIAWKLEVQR
ncbi:MAG: hypothetical protein KKH28_07395 [Elusimicrobia bacterium]|nr:hypothetical protein [Elusimicrobiota bacterium]